MPLPIPTRCTISIASTSVAAADGLSCRQALSRDIHPAPQGIETQCDVVLLFGQTQQCDTLGIRQTLHVLGQRLAAQVLRTLVHPLLFAAQPTDFAGQLPVTVPLRQLAKHLFERADNFFLVRGRLAHQLQQRITNCRIAAGSVVSAPSEVFAGQFQGIDHAVFDPRQRVLVKCTDTVAKFSQSLDGSGAVESIAFQVL